MRVSNGSMRGWTLAAPLLLGWFLAACGEDAAVGGGEDVDPGVDVAPDALEDAEAGGPDGDADGGEPDAACEVEPCGGAPVWRHDPASGALLTFPDDFFTESAETLTGLRVAMTPETMAGLESSVPRQLLNVFEHLSTLDGFGTSAGIVFRFTAPLDPLTLTSGEASAEPGSSLVLGWLDDSGALVRVPIEVIAADEGTTVILWPMVPLPAATRAVAAVTTTASGAGGEPAEPNALLGELIAGTAAPPLDRMHRRIGEAVTALVDADAIAGPEELAALTVFTTQSTTEPSLAVAADIRTRAWAPVERVGCEVRSAYRACELRVEAGHYRDASGVFATNAEGGPIERYTLEVSVLLPLEEDAGDGPPWPVMLYGHGLSGDRGQAELLARLAAPLGVATLAVDAPEHGVHPRRHSAQQLASVLDFFGISPVQPVDPAVLRDNFRQAAWDKLSLVVRVLDGLDVDGDEVVDLDADHLGYLGVSLGGIMGPELLALAPELEIAVLVVPGARLTDIFQFGGFFGPLVELLRPAGTTDGDVARFWPVLQTAIEAGDPVNWAPHLLTDPLLGQRPTQLLMGMVLDDEIVSNASNLSLARALGVPHVEPIVLPVGIVELVGAASVSGNLEGGGTAGLVQFDRIVEDGQIVAATHNNIGSSAVGLELWIHFIESWLATGVAEIIDPFEALGLERP